MLGRGGGRGGPAGAAPAHRAGVVVDVPVRALRVRGPGRLEVVAAPLGRSAATVGLALAERAGGVGDGAAGDRPGDRRRSAQRGGEAHGAGEPVDVRLGGHAAGAAGRCRRLVGIAVAAGVVAVGGVAGVGRLPGPVGAFGVAGEVVGGDVVGALLAVRAAGGNAVDVGAGGAAAAVGVVDVGREG